MVKEIAEVIEPDFDNCQNNIGNRSKLASTMTYTTLKSHDLPDEFDGYDSESLFHTGIVDNHFSD